MDTPRRTSRRLRIAVLFGLLVLVQSALAYLLSWIDPPRTPLFVPIQITSFDGWRLPAFDTNNLFADTMTVEPHRAGIDRALEQLGRRGQHAPVIILLRGFAVQSEAGDLCVLPADATIRDAVTWLPLREVLEKLQACPAKQKLLLLELAPPPTLARTGHVYHDFAAALPRELEAVPDASRLVLHACAPGQRPYSSAELDGSVFAHYLREALRGHADGYDDLRDGHITTKELATFVRARVERWSQHNRAERQTPTLHGIGDDFTVASIDGAAPTESTPRAPREYPPALLRAWQDRDTAWQAGRLRLTPRATQWQHAVLSRIELAGSSDPLLFNQLKRLNEDAVKNANVTGAPSMSVSDVARLRFESSARALQQQLLSAKPADVERIKKRFVEEMHGQLSETERDGVVFAHALAEPSRDPGLFRLCDQLLHSGLQPVPRSGEALRLRLLADLAMRVEVQAWPREVVQKLLDATASGERALQAEPSLPGFTELLDPIARERHGGEVRLWARGFASLEEARDQLTLAAARTEKLLTLNDRWQKCERVRDEAFAELPWYLEALEALPELREPWSQATASARQLADALGETPDAKWDWNLRVAHLDEQVGRAEKHAQALQRQCQTLHAPFVKEALVRLERQCRSPHADASTWTMGAALLSVSAPVLKAEERASLWQAVDLLAHRLNDETLALDRQDNEGQRRTPSIERRMPPVEAEASRAGWRASAQLALMELSGLAEGRSQALRQAIQRCRQEVQNPSGWIELSSLLRDLSQQQRLDGENRATSWRERDRHAWIAPPPGAMRDAALQRDATTLAERRRTQKQHDRWRAEHLRYVARDYHGLNIESPGIGAARGYYARTAGPMVGAPPVQMRIAGASPPLTEKDSYAHLELEITRQVPPGAFGPVELRFHRSGDVWLEVAPGSASLPALVDSKEPRTLTHKIPLKAMRKPRAERTGLPPPIGFLVEAICDGRSYHHLVNVPVIPSTQELQILVSTDPEEPGTSVNEIRIRPGKVKQPHYVYVRNLTNRVQRVHVEIRAGAAVMHKSQKMVIVEPDGVRKVLFDETARATELAGSLEVSVLDQDRQKVLAQRSLRVEVLSPHEYVRVAEAAYEPGLSGGNKWTVQVEATKPVAGPAIAAQLVLPLQRIPGLLGVGGGTLQVELPTRIKTQRILFAENLRLVHSVEEEGPVYLHIDGVPRAFVYRTTFSRTGQVTQPMPDERPAVRITAPPCVMAGIKCLVDVEVDNAPAGARLEVALGRADGDAFKAEVAREFRDAKKRRIDLETSRDALIFEAAIGDWTAMFETRSIVGARELQARLIDGFGKEIASARQSVVIDDSPPSAKFFPVPAQVQKGSVLQVIAEAADAESGVAQVYFFLGVPDKGEAPLGVPRYKAVPAGLDQNRWRAALMVPGDARGSLAVSVQVVNHAGLSSVDTVTVEVIDHEPGKTGLGEIRGVVMEGQRLQPNLLVTLLDQNGVEIARTRTLADGTYAFQKLAPGQYRVVCVKPDSQRRAVMNVIVGPDRTTKGDLALAL